jgi:ketosteroid isomerase-like protein
VTTLAKLHSNQDLNAMMRNYAGALALTLALGACSQQAAAPAAEAPAAAANATAAAAPTPQAEIDAIMARHLEGAKAGNVELIMADYADDAVLVTPPAMVTPTGVFAGKDKVREFFTWLASPAILPGPKSMVSTNEMVAPDTVLFRWTQFKGTPQEANGTDVFVIRNGKIVFQSVMPKG